MFYITLNLDFPEGEENSYKISAETNLPSEDLIQKVLSDALAKMESSTNVTRKGSGDEVILYE